jgi:hypothetical protein
VVSSLWVNVSSPTRAYACAMALLADSESGSASGSAGAAASTKAGDSSIAGVLGGEAVLAESFSALCVAVQVAFESKRLDTYFSLYRLKG